MRFNPLGCRTVSALPTFLTSLYNQPRQRLALLVLAAALAIPALPVQRLLAQDAPPAEAPAPQASDADLLKQGVDQFKNNLFEEAQATLTQVKPENLSDSDRKLLSKTLGKVETAANQRKAARAQFQQGEEALAANKTGEAVSHYKAVLDNDYADAGTIQKAKEQIALSESKQAAAAAESKASYDQAKADLAAGNLDAAKAKFQSLKEAGYKAPLFQKSPDQYLTQINDKVANQAAAETAKAAQAKANEAKQYYQAGKKAFAAKDYAAARENFTKAQESGYKAGLFEDSAAKCLARVDAAEKADATAKVAAEEQAAKKAADEAAAKKAAEELAAKKAEDEAAAKKAAEELAAKKAADEAAAKKAQEELAAKKAEDEAAAKKTTEELAAKKLEARRAYQAGQDAYDKGDFTAAREQFTKARDLGYKAGLFESNPATMLAKIDKKEESLAKNTVAVATPETSKPETPKVETPKPETPVVETPKPETPKPETPVVETPKPQTPVVTTPETPKPETPVATVPETPKTPVPTAPPQPQQPMVTPNQQAEQALTATAKLEQIRQQQRDYEASLKVDEARAREAQKDYSGALELYVQACKLDPTNEAAVAGRNHMLDLTGKVTEPSGLLSRVEAQIRARKKAIQYQFDTAIGKAREAVQGYNFAAAQSALDEAKVARDTDPSIFTQDEVRQMEIALSQTALSMDQARETKVKLDKVAADNATKKAERDRIVKEMQAKRDQISELIATTRRLIDERQYVQGLGVVDQILFIDPQNPYATGIRPWLQDKVNFLLQRKYNETYEQNITLQLNNVEEKMIPYDDILRYPTNWPDLTEQRDQTLAAEQAVRADDQAVMAQLDRRLPEVRFENVGFSDVIDFLRDITGTNIYVNWKALEGAGIDRNAAVSARLRDIKFSKALKIILSNLGGGNAKIGYMVDDGVITISTDEELGKNLVNRTYDIRDLILQIPDFDNAPDFSLQNNNQISQGGGGGGGGGNGGLFEGGGGAATKETQLSRQQLVDEITKLITETVAPPSWKDAGGTGSLRELAGQLIVNQTPEVHRLISELLAQLRETRALQIQIEARFLTVSRAYLEDVGVAANFTFNTNQDAGSRFSTIPVYQKGLQSSPLWGGNNSNGFTAPGNVLSTISRINATQINPLTSSITATMDGWQADFFIQAIEASDTSTTLSAPRITLFNGQRGFILVAIQKPYIGAMTPVVGARAVAYNPQLAYAYDGVVLDVAATISADRRYVTLTLRPQLSTILSMDTFNPVGGITDPNNVNPNDTVGTVGGVTLTVPTIALTEVKTTVSVPDQGTILLGGHTLASEIEREQGAPVVSKIPFLKRLFTQRGWSKDEKVLLILVKPTIVIQREVEAKAFPLLSSQVGNR